MEMGFVSRYMMSYKEISWLVGFLSLHQMINTSTRENVFIYMRIPSMNENEMKGLFLLILRFNALVWKQQAKAGTAILCTCLFHSFSFLVNSPSAFGLVGNDKAKARSTQKGRRDGNSR
jgi:hypothetical protein